MIKDCCYWMGNLLYHISIRRFNPLFGENCIIVSSNPDYDFLGCTRVEDIIPNKGPLGGIYTGLKYSKTKMNIVVSVDAPLVTTELLQWMFSKHSNYF
ncbi:MAG: NTP transferase domain-containing protein [Flavobacterium sp.]|nr:NTP transferase domain-containing protein [Flavobacterium sp.]